MKDPAAAYIQGAIIGAIIGLVVGVAIGLAIAPECPAGETTITEERHITYDTIRVAVPIPRDSVVLRYETARLPLATDTTDTAAVNIPITRVEYTDTNYRAIVEGYQPRLISLDITAPRETLTLTRTTTAGKQKHWGLSVGAGLTATRKGLEPGVFVGATYTFYSF